MDITWQCIIHLSIRHFTLMMLSILLLLMILDLMIHNTMELGSISKLEWNQHYMRLFRMGINRQLYARYNRYWYVVGIESCSYVYCHIIFYIWIIPIPNDPSSYIHCVHIPILAEEEEDISYWWGWWDNYSNKEEDRSIGIGISKSRETRMINI